MRSTALRAALAAAAVFAAPSIAHAQVEQMKIGDVFSAYNAICKDNLKDGKAQAAAATSAPFNATEATRRDDGSVVYKSGSMLIILRDVSTMTYCAVGGPIEGPLDLDAGRNLMIPTLGEPTKIDGKLTFWHLGNIHYAVTGGQTPGGQVTVLFASGVDKE